MTAVGGPFALPGVRAGRITTIGEEESGMRRVRAMIAAGAMVSVAGAASGAMIDFEGTRLGSSATAIGSLNVVHCDLGIDYRPTITGGVSSFGNAMITANGDAGGSGKELFVNNSLVEVEHGETLENVSFLFADFGSDVNLQFNGQSFTAWNFGDLNGASAGGATVSVSGNMVSILGPVTDFSLGGQSIVIDNLGFEIVTVPTPGAAALLGVAGLGAIRRRR